MWQEGVNVRKWWRGGLGIWQRLPEKKCHFTKFTCRRSESSLHNTKKHSEEGAKHSTEAFSGSGRCAHKALLAELLHISQPGNQNAPHQHCWHCWHPQHACSPTRLHTWTLQVEGREIKQEEDEEDRKAPMTCP